MSQALNRQAQTTTVASPGYTQATIATAASEIIGANQNRFGISFANPGTHPIYIAPAGSAIVVGQGLVVQPGTILTLINKKNFRVTCAWQAVASENAPLAILDFGTPLNTSGAFNPGIFVPIVLTGI